MKDAEFAKEIQTIIDRNMQQPERLNARLKLRLEDCCKADKKVDYLYDAEEWGLNPYGGVHGGIICSLFDTGMGIGAVALSGKMVSTADISVSYLKPMNGRSFRFSIEYTNVGKRMIRCMGKAADVETRRGLRVGYGQLCDHGGKGAGTAGVADRRRVTRQRNRRDGQTQ